MNNPIKTEEVRDEDLKVGDLVHVLQWVRIVAIKPYKGPLADIIHAIAETVPGVGFSLQKGNYSTRAAY